jgi:hypothetical protein
MLVTNDAGYSSASDFDEDTLALLVIDDACREDPLDEQIGTKDVEHYESLIV